jgi:small subunit ribosomal protein S21
MVEIRIKNPEDDAEFDKAVRLFKKLVNKEGHLQELKERRYYMKPSEKKRLERKQKNRRK